MLVETGPSWLHDIDMELVGRVGVTGDSTAAQ
jgi:hypothetical protein